MRTAAIPLVVVLLAPAPALAQITLPWFEGFEGTTGEVYRVDTDPLVGAPDWSFETDIQGEGRLRTAAGTGYYRSGLAAATLDRDPDGTEVTNYLIAHLDLSSYAVANDTVELSFSVLNHGEESDVNDRVWVRGTDQAAWLEVVNLNTNDGSNGTYVDLGPYDISAILSGAGQDFSSTTQLRFGQQDNFPSTSISASDGYTFDDIELIRVNAADMSGSAVVAPGDYDCGLVDAMVTVEVTNLGTTTQSNVPVTVDIAGDVTATLSGTAVGPLDRFDTGLVTVGPVDLTAASSIDITVTTGLVGDEDTSNDAFTETVMITPELIPLEPLAGACPGYAATTEVIPEPGTTYSWWDAATDGNELTTGESYTTAVLAAGGSETVWVQRDAALTPVGPADNTMGSGGNYTFMADGVVFDVLAPGGVTIDSMTVYPNGPGNVVALVEDSAGNFVDSATVAVNPPSPGAPVVIQVDLQVPQGTDFEVRADGSTTGGLYRNSGGASYPYTEPSGSIVLTAAENNLSNYYYFFYNWQILSEPCEGPRTEVTITADPAACRADLSISMTGPDPNVVAGTQAVYTIDIVNHGPHDATTVALDDQDPAGASFNSATGDCSGPFPCALPDLAPGATAQVVATFDVDSGFDTTLTLDNTAVVGSLVVDPNPGDEEVTVSSEVVAQADLNVQLEADVEPVPAGGLVSFTATVTNYGPSDARDVVATVTVPEGFTVDVTLGCDEDPAGVPTCSLGTVEAGSSALFYFDLLVPLEASGGFETSYEVVSSTEEVVPGDEFVAVGSTIVQEADVVVQVVPGAERVRAGQDVVFDVTLANDGPSIARGAALALALNGTFAFDEEPTGLEVGDMQPAAEENWTLRVPTAVEDSGTVELTATGSSTTTDPDEDNNEVLASVTLFQEADLSLTGAAEPNPATEGNDVRLVWTVRNAGPTPAADVELAVSLPEGLALPNPGDCTDGGTGNITCTLSLAVDGEEVVELVVTADAPGAYSILGSVSFGGEEASVGDEDATIELQVNAASSGDDDDDDRAEEGCNCRSSVADGSPSTAGLLALFGLLGLLRRRRS